MSGSKMCQASCSASAPYHRIEVVSGHAKCSRVHCLTESSAPLGCSTVHPVPRRDLVGGCVLGILAYSCKFTCMALDPPYQGTCINLIKNGLQQWPRPQPQLLPRPRSRRRLVRQIARGSVAAANNNGFALYC